MRIILMGPPASGKGSQNPFLTKKFNIPQISTGEMFRKEIKKQSEIGMMVEGTLKLGQFVSDDITNEIVRRRLLEDDARNGFILDGYPRTINQAQYLDNFLKEQNIKLDYVFSLYADDDLLIKRIMGRISCPNCGEIYNSFFRKPKVDGICDKCGAKLVKRSDDTLEVVKGRLIAYEQKTSPIINYYKEKGVLVYIDGTGTPEHSFDEIMKVVKG